MKRVADVDYVYVESAACRLQDIYVAPLLVWSMEDGGGLCVYIVRRCRCADVREQCDMRMICDGRERIGDSIRDMRDATRAV